MPQEPFSLVNPEQTREFSAADQALLRQDFAVGIDLRSTLLDFVPRTASAVLWRAVVLVAVTADTPSFQPPNALFGEALSIGATTFGSAKGALHPDVVFGAAMLQSASNPRGKVRLGASDAPGMSCSPDATS